MVDVGGATTARLCQARPGVYPGRSVGHVFNVPRPVFFRVMAR